MCTTPTMPNSLLEFFTFSKVEENIQFVTVCAQHMSDWLACNYQCYHFHFSTFHPFGPMSVARKNWKIIQSLWFSSITILRGWDAFYYIWAI